MNNPNLFPDEIAERLRDLHHGDKVIVCSGGTEQIWTCYESAVYDDGIVSPFRRFETVNRSVVDHIVDRLYSYSEHGDGLYVVKDGVRQPF